MLKKVLLGVVGLCALLAGIGILLPGTVRIERSILIERPPAIVFATLDDLHQFNDWSPWYGLDPAATYELKGPHTGPGSSLTWSGNDAVGSGTLRIVANDPPRRIDVTLELAEFPASTSHFVLEPEPNGTQVTWAFEGELGLNPLMRWMGLFMDGWVGPDYARGLAKLKRHLEVQPSAAPESPSKGP